MTHAGDGAIEMLADDNGILPERAKYQMRLFEIETPKLHLCTSLRKNIGSVISVEGNNCAMGPAIEAVLEAKRPEDCVPRQTSMILVPTPHAAHFVYVVEPVGKLDCHHTGWLKVMTETDPSQTGVMAASATCYWSGIECPDARQEPYEYRAAQVRILGRIGGSGHHLAAR